MKKHIHCWNNYDKNLHLICSTCGISYNDFMKEARKEEEAKGIQADKKRIKAITQSIRSKKKEIRKLKTKKSKGRYKK